MLQLLRSNVSMAEEMVDAQVVIQVEVMLQNLPLRFPLLMLQHVHVHGGGMSSTAH